VIVLEREYLLVVSLRATGVANIVIVLNGAWRWRSPRDRPCPGDIAEG
jgi:hypothetical protein